jgi:hypothetical protein
MKKIRTFFLSMDGCMERDLNLNLEFEMNKLKKNVLNMQWNTIISRSYRSHVTFLCNKNTYASY